MATNYQYPAAGLPSHFTQPQATALAMRTAQLMASRDYLGPTGDLDQWMDDVKQLDSDQVRKEFRDASKQYHDAEKDLQSELRKAFEAVGFSVPSQTSTSAQLPSRTLVGGDFSNNVSDLVASDRAIGSKATQNGTQRFHNVVLASQPSHVVSPPLPFASTPLTYDHAVELVQLALSREAEVALELWGLHRAGLVNERVRRILRAMAIGYAKVNAIQSLYVVRAVKARLPPELRIIIYREYIVPPPAWDIGVDGGPGPYSHPNFPAEFKLDWSLPKLSFDIQPGWPFTTDNIYGWEASLSVSPAHAVDHDDLCEMAVAYYQSRDPFVWSGFVDTVLQHNVFGSNLFKPYTVMRNRMEVGLSYMVPQEDGMLSNDDDAAYAGDVLDVKTLNSGALRLSTHPQALGDLTITAKLLFEPLEYRKRRNEVITPEDILVVIEHVVTAVESYWNDNYNASFVGPACNHVKMRFWPVCSEFAGLANDGSWWLFEEIGWDRLKQRVEEVSDLASSAVAQEWLAFAAVDTLNGWKHKLQGSARATILPEKLRRILELRESPSSST